MEVEIFMDFKLNRWSGKYATVLGLDFIPLLGRFLDVVLEFQENETGL